MNESSMGIWGDLPEILHRVSPYFPHFVCKVVRAIVPPPYVIYPLKKEELLFNNKPYLLYGHQTNDEGPLLTGNMRIHCHHFMSSHFSTSITMIGLKIKATNK